MYLILIEGNYIIEGDLNDLCFSSNPRLYSHYHCALYWQDVKAWLKGLYKSGKKSAAFFPETAPVLPWILDLPIRGF